MNAGGALAIGIDVGGTKIAAGLLDPATGERSDEHIVPTRADLGGYAVLRECASIASALSARSGGRATGIGIGLPELVDPQGRPTSGEAVDWRDLDIDAGFADLPPVTLEADVRAAAIAEDRFGAGKPFAHWIYISIGTGISSAIVTNGRPMVGARGAALVLSSGPISVPCPRCGELVRFTLEEYASGSAIERRWREAGGSAEDSTREILAAAEGSDELAGRIVDSAAIALGGAIGWLVNVTDPEAVVLGGGLGSAEGIWRETLIAAIRDHIWNPAASTLLILPAALGPAAGWIGAALAASDRHAAETGKESPAFTAANR